MRPRLAAVASIPAMATRGTRSEGLSPGRAVGLVILFSLHFWPRLFILGFAIFSWGLLIDAFSGWVVWVAGFFLLPWTTITYMTMWGIYSDRVYGVEWVFVGLAVLLDLFTWWSTLRK
jgi:hypothetical protein